jgi:hypothetical protein
MTDEQKKEFELYCNEVICWLNENANPHSKVIITTVGAELLSGEMIFVNEDFLKD